MNRILLFSALFALTLVACAEAANITENVNKKNVTAKLDSRAGLHEKSMLTERGRSGYATSSQNGFRYLITTLGQQAAPQQVYGAPQQQVAPIYGQSLVQQPTYGVYVTTTTPQPAVYVQQPMYGQQQQQPVYAQVPVYGAPASSSTATVALFNNTLLGGACSDNNGCATVKNSRCVAGICTCIANTVPLSNVACVPVATAFGQGCVISAQCRALDQLASCYLDRCLCESIYFVAGQNCNGIQTDSTYFTINAATSSGISCVRKATLGQKCCTDNQCSYEVWNSSCEKTTGTCQCNAGFINIGTHSCAQKVMNVGEACSVSSQCMFPGSICSSNGQCICNLPLFCNANAGAAASGRRKRQAISLAANLVVSPVTTTSVTVNGCVPTKFLGESCINDDQCTNRTLNSACIGGICACANGFVRLDGSQQCVPIIYGLSNSTQKCVVTDQCRTLNAICNGTSGTCTCNGASFCEVAGVCAAKTAMNGACMMSCQCTTMNSICNGGQCACATGFMFNAGNNTCIQSTLFFNNGFGTYFFPVSCCRNTTGSRFVGQVIPDAASTVPGPDVFSLSANTAGFVISPTGVITVPSVPNQSATTTLTATVVANGLTATTNVVIIPEACCAAVPSSTLTASFTVPLVPLGGTAGNCGGLGAPVANQSPTSSMLMMVPINLFSVPCGEALTQVMTTVPVVATPVCAIMNGMLQFTANTILVPAPGPTTALCVFVASGVACNGLTASTTMTLTISAGPGC